ncbi:MAG: hypothetical protein RML32_12335, partial [Gammaproteobacteria bacterium]|nr:hypothetical protein [Gammaproteobacteria bacterium]
TTPRGTAARSALQHAHISVGLTAFFLVLPRLWLWRRLGRPPAPAGIPLHADDFARQVNLAFYLTVLAFGITGWLFAAAEGHAVSFWGLFTLPALLAPGYRPSVTLGYLHSALGFWIFYLAGFALCLAIYQRIRYRVPLLRLLPVFRWS